MYFSSRHHMGHHGSYIVGHGSLLEWVNGSWVTVSDPLPALTCSDRLTEFTDY